MDFLRRSSNSVWRGAALLLASLPLGCGTFVGASTVVPMRHNRVELGPSAGYRAYLGESSGLFLGGAATLGLPQRQSHDSGRAYLEGRIGYGNAPLPTKSHFGFEAWLGPAMGWAPSSKQLTAAPGWTLAVGVPYRISADRQPWELGDRAFTYSFIQPSVGFVQLIPVVGDRRIDSMLVASLVIGTDSWLLVQP